MSTETVVTLVLCLLAMFTSVGVYIWIASIQEARDRERREILRRLEEATNDR